jgi:hypothetical protein
MHIHRFYTPPAELHNSTEQEVHRDATQPQWNASVQEREISDYNSELRRPLQEAVQIVISNLRCLFVWPVIQNHQEPTDTHTGR